MNRGGLVGAENDTPSLEVSFRNDGHPPLPKGTGDSPERHLWGKILGMPESIFRFGHFFVTAI
jgi:hypothetical protein